MGQTVEFCRELHLRATSLHVAAALCIWHVAYGGARESEGADEAEGAEAQVDAPHKQAHVGQVQQHAEAAEEVQRVHHEAQRVEEDVECHTATPEERPPPTHAQALKSGLQIYRGVSAHSTSGAEC